jgi:effector-binding domain-containing protein
MSYEIESRPLTEQPTAVRRATVMVDMMGSWLSATYAAVAAYLARAGAAMAGPPFARFAFHDRQVDVEAGFPVGAPIEGDASVVPAVLPGGPAAVTTHHGPYEGLEAAYKAVHAWLADRGCEASGDHWEVYYSDPAREPDSARWRTDVVVPYHESAQR